MIGSTDPKANLKNKLNLTFAAHISSPPYASKGQNSPLPFTSDGQISGVCPEGDVEVSKWSAHLVDLDKVPVQSNPSLRTPD